VSARIRGRFSYTDTENLKGFRKYPKLNHTILAEYHHPQSSPETFQVFPARQANLCGPAS
jgi:hypothetical protein